MDGQFPIRKGISPCDTEIGPMYNFLLFQLKPGLKDTNMRLKFRSNLLIQPCLSHNC